MPYRSPEEQRQYQRIWIQRRRAKWFEGKSCERCGEDNYDRLAVESQIGERLPKLWSRSVLKREKILTKHNAIVVCRRCLTLDERDARGLEPSGRPFRPGGRALDQVPDSVPVELRWEWLRWIRLACPMPVHDSYTMAHHLPLTHSEATRKKISEGVKSHHRQRKVVHVDFENRRKAS